MQPMPETVQQTFKLSDTLQVSDSFFPPCERRARHILLDNPRLLCVDDFSGGMMMNAALQIFNHEQ